MEKYRKVPKPKVPSPPDEIRVTGVGFVRNYVTYSAKLFNELHYDAITIRATGKAVSIAVSAAEVVKRRFKGLHQLTTIGCTRLMNEYEPLEEGLDKIEESRTVSFISIHLARGPAAEKLDKNAAGYQPPLDDSLVKELDQQIVTRFMRRPRGRGRGGRGFSRGGMNYGGRGGRGRTWGGGAPFQGHPFDHSMQQGQMDMDGPHNHTTGTVGGQGVMYDDFGGHPAGRGRRPRRSRNGDYPPRGMMRGRGGFRGVRGRGGRRGGPMMPRGADMSHTMGHVPPYHMHYVNDAPAGPMMPHYPGGQYMAN